MFHTAHTPHPTAPTRRVAPLATRLGALLLLTVLLASCVGGIVPGGPGSFDDARSVSCDATRGAEALYWDFMNGVIRVDYPETIRFLPFPPGSTFIHPTQPLYNFSFPPGWQVDTLIDGPSNLAGANVVRPDGQVVWRRLSFAVSGTVSPNDYLNFEIDQMRDILGIAGPIDFVCSPPSNGTNAAALIRTGDFTANVSVQVFVSPFLGGTVSNIFAQVAIAPTAEYNARAVDVFFPLSGQMNLGGGSSDPECSDGIDNDGDGQTDYPDDNGCTSETDDSE
jgi:hypothetical protein